MKENQLIEIKDLFNVSRWFKPDPVASKPLTERGVLLQKFSEKTGKPIGYIAMRLTGVPTKELGVSVSLEVLRLNSKTPYWTR